MSAGNRSDRRRYQGPFCAITWSSVAGFGGLRAHGLIVKRFDWKKDGDYRGAEWKNTSSEPAKNRADRSAAKMNNLLLWVSPVAVLFAASGIAAAQDVDPPSRVARISYIAGPVSFEPASVDQWTDASLNYPMTTGDNLYTDAGARAVLRIGQNSIRLNSGTNFQFVNLSDNVVQTSINAGGLSLRVRRLLDGESWEIDTPNGAVTILRPGEYRVDTDASRNATMVTVRTGDVEVTAGNQSFPVHSGQTAWFDSSGNPPDVQAASQPDDFDSFASSRDRLEDVPVPAYVSPDMVGYEDLNANGEWRNTADYGAVWTPRVAAGWTPYHDGRWAWIEPWGWTWVDDEPWGFAPFHYGRWAYVDNRWSWCPGAVSARVYYAPALVAFVGGGGFSVGVSIGGGGGGLVGWFPLGPREPYYPSYHVSQGYIRQVNVTNTRITNVNVTNINVTNISYANRGAIVAMPQNSFVAAQRVQRVAVRVDAGQMRQAQVIGAAPPVVPQRESVLGNGEGRKAAAPPPTLVNRPVVARLAPPPPAVPFAARQQMLQQHPGTPVAPAQLQTLRAQPAGQNPVPARIQVQPIDTKLVHPVTPAVRPGPAPAFAQRPVPPQNRPAQPANPAPFAQPVPSARPQSLPSGSPQPQLPVRQAPQPREQVQPPVRQAAPAVQQAQPPERQAPQPREQVQPPVRQAAPAVQQAQPPERQAPQPREQVQPPVRQAAPAAQQAQPPERQAPQPREQVQPPVRQAAPAAQQAQPPVRQAPAPREQVQPPVRQAAPAAQQAQPPVRQAPPPREQAQPPVRQAPPAPRPEAQPQRQQSPPPTKETRKPEDRKQ
jgi:hypothetical protein